MTRTPPTFAQIAEWGMAAICPDEVKRADAVRNLTFAYYLQREIISNLEARIEQLESERRHALSANVG